MVIEYDGGNKKDLMKYNYDHIKKLLLEKYAWVRVPWWIPGADLPREYGIIREDEKDDREKGKHTRSKQR